MPAAAAASAAPPPWPASCVSCPMIFPGLNQSASPCAAPSSRSSCSYPSYLRVTVSKNASTIFIVHICPHGNLLSLSGFYPSSGGGAHKPWRDGSRSASSACPLQPDRSPSSSCGYHGSPWKNITGTTSDGGSSSAKPLGWENLLPSDHDIIRALAAVSP